MVGMYEGYIYAIRVVNGEYVGASTIPWEKKIKQHQRHAYRSSVARRARQLIDVAIFEANKGGEEESYTILERTVAPSPEELRERLRAMKAEHVYDRRPRYNQRIRV